MSPISKITLKDWQAEQLQDTEFVATENLLEPGYQIARLRNQRGLTQAELATMIGTRQPSIARLENGSSVPSLSFLERIANALDARIELHVVPR